jgi:rubrerythrin
MANELHDTGEVTPYDYRRVDQVWQRVAPSLSPYPNGIGGTADLSRQETPPRCCMNGEELPGLLQGFLEEELADRRYYLAFARQAPASARQTLREIALDEGEHARMLGAAYYLASGQCICPDIGCARVYIGSYCPALRERYREETCGAQAYLRAAEETEDPCLKRLLNRIAADEYRHADALAALLERALAGACGRNGMGV